MYKTGMVALLALSFFVLRGYAQTTPAPSGGAPPAQKTETPAIVTNADEVTLDLVVHDKRNKPVLDLKPQDIAVADSGAAVKLADLRLVTGASSAEHRITLVFDRLDPSAAKNAHDIVAKILKIIPPRQFSFSVLNVEGRLRLFQEFTTDVAGVEKAVGAATERGDGTKEDAAALPEKDLISAARAGTDSSGAHISAQQRNVARVMLASLQESQRIVQEQHAQPSLSGLLALARTQRQFPGRKVIIYFTEGLPPDASAKDMLSSIAGAANRAGISIYVIDKTAVDTKVMEGMVSAAAMGGLATYNIQNPPPTGPAAVYPRPYGPGMVTMFNDQVNRFEIEELNPSKDPLAQLAANTGGAYIFSEDNLKKPFRQLVSDLTTYYEASYVPPIQEYDGKFRPVAVQPVRKGLKIHSRAGYFAVPPD
ncbi:MAG: VWA domain-containing protein, partial [Candidatus Sulfotelmatobacter sp.]